MQGLDIVLAVFLSKLTGGNHAVKAYTHTMHRFYGPERPIFILCIGILHDAACKKHSGPCLLIGLARKPSITRPRFLFVASLQMHHFRPFLVCLLLL